jgi:hypothetical protein
MIIRGRLALAAQAFPAHEGLEVKCYVHKLLAHLAACDRALVQGGLER